MKQTKWNQLRGDGASQPCDANRLTKIKDEFKQLATDAGWGVNDRRSLADDVRFCRWPGQSPDGKKHADAQGGKAAFPFEGASDKRERTADAITNEQVIIIMAALMRLNIGFTGMPGEDSKKNDELADSLGVLWEWVKRNQLGSEWFVEWTKFAQWRQGDSPAVGFMQVSWHQEYALKPVTVSVQDVTDLAYSAAQAHNVPLSPEDELDIVDTVVNPERVEDLAGLLQSLWDGLSDASAAKAAAALLEDQEATFPVPYICENRLQLKARRMFDDIFVPENTPTDLKRARIIYVREWYSEAELRERDAQGDFKAGFLDKVLEHEGESGWRYFTRYDHNGEFSESPIERQWNKARQRGLYELITAFYRGSNSDGIPGIYSVEYHANVETAGTDQVLLDYELGGGRYPFVGSQRELLTSKLWDSRGNSELSATEQNALKLLHDSFMDHAQLTTVPPIEVPASRPKMKLVWGPLKEIRVNRPGEIKPFQMWQYPSANDKMQAIVKEGLARYFGQFAESNPPDLVRLYNQSLVDFMLLPVVEVMWMGLKLCQQYLPAETLQQILGPTGNPGSGLERTLDGEFRVEANFEAGMLSLDFLEKVGGMITNFVLPWDKDQTIPRAELVKWYFSALAPTVANRITRPVEDANQSEIDDEENNFAKISAGIEPPMVEDGQNYALRRSTLLDIGQKNPEAFQTLAPNSRLILEARLKHFDGMLEQEQNAVIGRTMAKPALQGAPAAGA